MIYWAILRCHWVPLSMTIGMHAFQWKNNACFCVLLYLLSFSGPCQCWLPFDLFGTHLGLVKIFTVCFIWRVLFLQTRNPPILPPFSAIFKGNYSALNLLDICIIEYMVGTASSMNLVITSVQSLTCLWHPRSLVLN